MAVGISVEEYIRKYGIPKQLIKIQDLEDGTPAKILPFKGLKPGVYSVVPEILAAPDMLTPIENQVQKSFLTGTYVEIVSWQASESGYLREFSLDSDTRATAQWRVEIAGKTPILDEKFQNPYNAPYDTLNDGKGLPIKKGQVVKISAKSDGAATIKFDGSIRGLEVI